MGCRQFLWCMAVGVAMVGMVMAAPSPLDSTHHDVKKELPSELESDEEVRQLLDLKGLAAQRDLGNLKRQIQPNALTHTSSATPDSPQGDTTDHNKGGMADQQPNEENEGTKDKEGNKEEQANTHKTVPSGMLNEPHVLPLQGDRQLHNDHFHLKRQQLSRPHARYTPLDLALYVYKTGDEEGVTLAIQELIAEGLMTAEEALSYLREIRENLHYLNQQDEAEQEIGPDERELSENGMKHLMKKSSLPLPLTEMSLGDPESMLSPEMDYDILLDRLRGQDYVSTEYSLEEVIYQLAKILFKQAMHREGDIGSEKALQEVAALLEKEAARGAITPEVEKKVLDVMVNSLVDSISENENPSGHGPMIGGGPSYKLANQSPFPMGNSAMIGGSSFKPQSDSLFHLSKTTTKREAPPQDHIKKVNTEDKN